VRDRRGGHFRRPGVVETPWCLAKIARGECLGCAGKPEPGRRRCKACLERARAYAKAYYREHLSALGSNS
jgi:hypothetical protein